MRETARALFNTEDVLAVDRELIETVKRRAAASPEHTFRACLHRATEDPVQEMIVASLPDATRPPHRHPGRAESHLLVEGEITVFFFDAAGNPTRRLDLAPAGGGKPFCLRVGPDVWHMIVFRPPVVVYYETMAGPYMKEGTNVWAPWAPKPEDRAALTVFVERLLRHGKMALT
jgi:cupin fold WbuC family metalloprotein